MQTASAIDEPSGTIKIDLWGDAVLAATLLAVDPFLLSGAVVHARSGPVRDRWFTLFTGMLPSDMTVRKLPVHAGLDRILGGLDLAATLAAGRPVSARGLLAESDGGVVTVSGAERLDREKAAQIASVMDNGEVLIERDGITDRSPARFGLILFDESQSPDEAVPAVLADRVALHFDLETLSLRDAVAMDIGPEYVQEARENARSVTVDDQDMEALSATGMMLGISSARPVLQALAAARICAALDGRSRVEKADMDAAFRLVLLPRATQIPAPPDEDQTEQQPEQPVEPPQPTDSDDPQNRTEDASEDRMVEAAKAVIPADLLNSLISGAVRRSPGVGSGRSGEEQRQAKRGRPVGVQTRPPYAGARPKVIDTLRAAAPWQSIRRKASNAEKGRLLVAKEDFRYAQLKHRAETVTIFVVDASGSAAVRRLAEAKGAVELLLADCYVRRDQVAVIAFRRDGAEVLLPPTRSLTRAKKALAALPGGGGTPLAAGLDAALALATSEKRQGRTPLVVVLTDGRANIAKDGTADRSRASADAEQSAQALYVAGFRGLLIDTATRPDRRAASLAKAMHASYLPLPQADAAGMNTAIRAIGDARA